MTARGNRYGSSGFDPRIKSISMDINMKNAQSVFVPQLFFLIKSSFCVLKISAHSVSSFNKPASHNSQNRGRHCEPYSSRRGNLPCYYEIALVLRFFAMTSHPLQTRLTQLPLLLV